MQYLVYFLQAELYTGGGAEYYVRWDSKDSYDLLA
jgi:hypothetical protein